MNIQIHGSLLLFAALGLLSTAYAADTSQWKCETCPYPKGTTAMLEAGVGAVSDDSAKFGDFSGLERKGAHLVLGGTVTHRREGGHYADLAANDLGLDTRSLSALAGSEGLYALRLGYSQIPRHFADGAFSPFLGNGSAVLTLPAGYPAPTSTAMPLATTLAPIALGLDRRRLDLGGTWVGVENWTFRASYRRDVRDGTRPITSSFFATAAQFAAPVDHVTDELAVSASYARGPLQATLGVQYSQFSNGQDSITWANPFTPVATGSTRGQLALAPDNRMQQVVGSALYQITPTLRASADFALGQMTQNASYLAATLNPGLVVPALPRGSLDGRVDTFNANVKLSATPIAGLRINTSYARDVRDNRTDIASYANVATDIFVNPGTRSNTPFGLWQDRIKLEADYRGLAKLRLASGVEYDQRERNFHEVLRTRETTLWGRVGVQASETLSLAAKLAHGERDNSSYGVATWFSAVDNPLLRKFNLASRKRDAGQLRADWAASEKISIGLTADYAHDDYDQSLIGLQQARSAALGADIALAISDATRLSAFAQGERIRSRQAGSEALGVTLSNWSGRSDDRFELLGVGIKHAALAGKLEIGADLSISRSRSSIDVQTVLGEPPFPNATTRQDSLKLYANYKLDDKMSLSASYWYEDYRAEDWRLTGVLPGSIASLLSFGAQPPHYRVNVVRVSMRYRF